MSHSQVPMSIFDHLQQPALALDCEGRVIVWNNSMEQYTGISAEEIVGKGDYAHGKALFGEKCPTLANSILTHDESGGGRYRLLHHESGELLAESQMPARSGRTIVCMAAPLYDTCGRQIGAVETICETRPDETADESRGVLEEQVQILASTLPDMIFTLNRDGVFTQFFWTGGWMQGVKPEEIVGKTPHALLPQDEADFLAEAAHRVIETGEIVTEVRTFVWGGEERSFQVAVHPLHNASGGIMAAAGVSREITREIAWEQASLYLDLLGTDIYNTSMVAATIIEMLRDRLSGEEAELAQRVKITIEQGINVIKNVELLTTLNKHRVHLEPVDISALICAQMKRYAGIDIRYESGTCMVWANPLFEHIISNLISNSIKFGGMKVRIDISVMETEDTVVLSVADTGIGIPDHVKLNVFDRFSCTGARAASGSRGLGLHIVRTLVNQYGGRVWAADRVPGKPEEGATIKIILQKC
ncbi:MAG: PAS domain-containing protein [Methanomicrobiales archaeon]|nr:PAS domain-containing protein [Methanomicrobiales archaeon]